MLRTEIRGATAWVTLDRAEKLNAMPRSFWSELDAVTERLDSEPGVRAVVFLGAGRCFSVGGDIEDFGNIGGVADRRAYMREALGALRGVEQMTKPTIAAVHGHALGGGCELTIMCDIVVADATAEFGMPEAGVGLVPGAGIVRGLAQTNMHWMKYMILTGLPLSATEAHAAGLVTRLVAEGEHHGEAERLADAIVSRSPLALAVGKDVLQRGSWDGYQHAVEAIALLQSAPDFAEGIAAFSERRTPSFPDPPGTVARS